METAEQILAQEGKGFADLPEAEGIRRCRAHRARSTQRQEQDALLADFGVRFDGDDLGAVRSTTPARRSTRSTSSPSGASPTSRKAPSGSAPPTSATTRTGCFARAMAPTPTSPPTSPITSTSWSAGSSAPSTSGARITTATCRGSRSLLKAMGHPDDFFEVALVQLVKVVRGGEEVKMSKRSGEFVTLRDLLDEVGVDAARYFFLMRQGSSPFTFDVDLATRQTDENPVYYVQMAHARMSGIFRVAEREPESVSGDVSLEAPPGARGLGAAQEARGLSRSRGQGRADRASRTGSPITWKTWRASPTAGTTSAECSANRLPPRRRASHWPAPPASCWATASRCSASPHRIGCDMSLLVVGSVALDSISTPFGEVTDALGGSAVYFSAAASLLGPVRVVGVVGSDYPVAELQRIRPGVIDWSGVESSKGKLPLAGEVLLRPEQPRDPRHPARRLRQLPPVAARLPSPRRRSSSSATSIPSCSSRS